MQYSPSCYFTKCTFFYCLVNLVRLSFSRLPIYHDRRNAHFAIMRCSLSQALRWAAFWAFVIIFYVAYTLEHQISHYASDFIESYYVFPSSSIGQSVIANETLGFEKIFAVGLPERSDKRDALALTSSLTGFKIDWIDGVRGESVPDEAVPPGADRAQLWEANLGSWRGHMNAIRT